MPSSEIYVIPAKRGTGAGKCELSHLSNILRAVYKSIPLKVAS